MYAAYESAYWLWLNLLLVPLATKHRKDIISILMLGIFIVGSFIFFRDYTAFHTFKESFSFDNLTLSWSDSVKIDGAKVKGFATDSSGKTYYVIYSISSEQEKIELQSLQLAKRTVTVSGTAELPEQPVHSFAFNMNSYLRMNGSSIIVKAQKMRLGEVTEQRFERLYEQRKIVKKQIADRFPASLRTEAEALLIGDRSSMDDELSARYRTLGITHLFAISGLHVGLLTLILRNIAKRLFLRIETIDTLLFLLLPCYAVMAGGAPTVWRAVTVTMILLLSTAGKVKVSVDDALALSAIGFLFMKPYVLFQPGFQLSYGAAIALVYSASFLRTQRSAIGLSVSVTAITQIALSPILLYHFFELSISSFIVNILFVPLYSFVILPCNLLLLIISFLSHSAAEFLFVLYEPFRISVDGFSKWLARFPGQLWVGGRPNGVWIVILMIGILSGFIYIERTKKLIIGLLIILLPYCVFYFQPYFDSTHRITYLDVGQGDSIIIELAHRKGVYVIDTGGNVSFGEPDWRTPEKVYQIGRQVVLPFLKGRGISKIDHLIITHAHSDHMEAADEVLQDMRVGEIHAPFGSYKEEQMAAIVKETNRQNVPLLTKRAGDSWNVGEAIFTYISPLKENYSHNNSSLVLFLNIDERNYLFTGDLEAIGEQEILSRYKQMNQVPVILKVGHHGSDTSSTDEFLNLFQPELAVISAGRNNRYGHPHPDVLARLRERQIPVLITAEHGTIEVRQTGERVELYHSRQKKKDSYD